MGITKETRQFAAAGVFVGLILVLLLFLTFVPIPSGNKDLIVSIISMFVGGLGVAIGRLFGDTDEEKEAMQSRLADQDTEISILKTQFTSIKAEYDKLIAMLVERHVVYAEGIEPKAGN